MVSSKAIAPGVKGKERKAIVQLHRLVEFEAAFSAYLEGKASADYVRVRARKMLEAGLPRLK